MKNYKKLALLFLLSTLPSFAQNDKPLEGLNIMLDPGHGGADSGAIGRLGLKESDTNLRVARYLKMLLEHDGANVSLTRTKNDEFKSLSERVSLANKNNPDLFISIHHNASLNPNPTNHSQIYYNAMDIGVSKYVGEQLSEGLLNNKFAGNSVTIPGGFYVLRNNNTPAILTEGSYISIPESEKNLRSGKGLTKEAEILWKSLRKAYSNGSLNLDFYCNTNENIILTSPYFNLLFTANKAVKSVNATIDNYKESNLGIKNIMAYPMTYSLYNTKPLNSGRYTLSVVADGFEGLPSKRKNLNLVVALPINKIRVGSVAPYIPMGYKGKFPLDIKLYDDMDRINTRGAIACIEYGNKKSEILTNPSGITTTMLELDGTEVGDLEVKVTVEDSITKDFKIPVVMPIQHCVFGELTGINDVPLSKAKISYDGKTITKTNENGYFYFEYKLSVDNLNVEVEPRNGHKNIEYTIKNNDSHIVNTKLQSEPISVALFDKKIGIMAPSNLDDMVRSLSTPLEYCGANIIRLDMPENVAKPEYQAVLEANKIKDLNIIISLKTENIKDIQIRHYHSSKNGKKLADAVKNTFKEKYKNISVKSCAGSDYELGHSGATAIVIALPNRPDNKTRESLLTYLSNALNSN
jgi:N-acetylmuramoyl-L-alanine amidase